jgi:microsomal prostaglandin-E synthase 2
MVGSLLAAGSTGAACAFCSAAAAPASVIHSSTDIAWPRVTLYQYEPCPYCCKVKAVLDYLRIPYHVVEVNPLSKAETKTFTDYKKVPVLRLDDDEVVVDSSVIIARLRALAVERGVHQADASDDQSGVSLAEEEAWRKWVDDKLIILTPPNIYRTVPEALQSFEYVLTEGKFTALERQLAKYSGAAIMYIVAKRAKKKYGIDDERAALYAALNAFVDAVGKERPFLGGAQPNTADLSVFGVLRAMEGLKTYDDLMQQSSIAPWFERMRAAVGPSTRVVESA